MWTTEQAMNFISSTGMGRTYWCCNFSFTFFWTCSVCVSVHNDAYHWKELVLYFPVYIKALFHALAVFLTKWT